MGITLARETINQIWGDVSALAPLHHKDAGSPHDDNFDLDVDAYAKLEAIDILRIFTAREDGKLIGYCSLVVSPRNTLSKRVKWAHQDSFFVVPEYRGPMVVRFLFYQDLSLEADGVTKVYRHSNIYKPYDRLLLHTGYQLVDHGFVRELREAA